jgi:fructose-1,6-bisphosphatase/sedoheptulose 1,7-bisphosphatase-like protein
MTRSQVDPLATSGAVAGTVVGRLITLGLIPEGRASAQVMRELATEIQKELAFQGLTYAKASKK